MPVHQACCLPRELLILNHRPELPDALSVPASSSSFAAPMVPYDPSLVWTNLSLWLTMPHRYQADPANQEASLCWIDLPLFSSLPYSNSDFLQCDQNTHRGITRSLNNSNNPMHIWVTKLLHICLHDHKFY